MAGTNYLFIKNLNDSVDPSLVHPRMRKKFLDITKIFGAKRVVPWTGKKPADDDTNFLVPVAYNLIVDALENDSLRDRLQQIGSDSGYWFFNVFLLPENPAFSIGVKPTLGMSKGVTTGVANFEL